MSAEGSSTWSPDSARSLTRGNRTDSSCQQRRRGNEPHTELQTVQRVDMVNKFLLLWNRAGRLLHTSSLWSYETLQDDKKSNQHKDCLGGSHDHSTLHATCGLMIGLTLLSTCPHHASQKSSPSPPPPICKYSGKIKENSLVSRSEPTLHPHGVQLFSSLQALLLAPPEQGSHKQVA